MLLRRTLLFLRRRAFLLLALFFLALRLGTLLTSVEYVSWDEELYRGTIAKEIVEGLKVPLWDYQADRYDGGSLAVGMLAAPFFFLLGPNLFALKLVPLCFSLAILILTMLFFQRFFDRRAALLTGALWVLPPPVLTALSLSAIGSHPESFLFSIAMLFALYQFLYGRTRRLISLALFGLIAGLGFWFTSITFITTLACLASWALINHASFFSWRLLVFLGSFGVGALPWVAYNIAHQFCSIGFFTGAFLAEGSLASWINKLADVPTRMAVFLLDVLPSMFRFRPTLGIPSSLLTLAYGLLAGSLIGLFLWRQARSILPVLRASLSSGRVPSKHLEGTKPLPFLLFFFLFILVYCLSNYPLHPFPQEIFVGFRYLSPLYYFTLCLLALALHLRKRPLLPLGVLLSLGLIGQSSLLLNEPAGRALKYKGTSTVLLGYTWGGFLHPFPEGLGPFQRLADRFNPEQRRYLYWGLSYLLSLVDTSEGAFGEIQKIPPEYRAYFIEDWGRYLATFRPEEFDRNLSLGRTLTEDEQPYFYYGLATKMVLGIPDRTARTALRLFSIQRVNPSYQRFYYFDLGRQFYWALLQQGLKGEPIEISQSVQEEEKAWFYRGMGADAAQHWILSHRFARPFDPLVEKFPTEAEREFLWGVGWGLWALDRVEDRLRVLDWLQRLEDREKPWALKGFEAFEQWYRIAPER